ncbi:MAG: T9SS type B sorting domain-containing protein, partial [Bacteroidota bacterium]
MSLNRLLSGGSITGITILLFFMPLRANAQIDDTFWFTAPEVTSNHGDEEVVLRLTAFDNDAEVTIALPANTGFGEKTVNVAANTQETFQFSDADIVENKPAGQVNNKGILITSDVDISAYYEVTHGNNPDKFTLKGNNALGTEFFVPSQNAFQNHHYSTPAREHADIVATEDGTQVEITVSDEVKGHTAGSTFTVNLNRGETYSLTATSEAADRHLGGTQITSNKPIAVTISDDSIEVPGEEGCWDLIGDQLIPVSLLGSEYIAMNPLYGEGISNGVHKVFVLAVADGTNLYVNENETPKELEQGDLLELDITDNALYLNSNKPFYAYEVTGIPHQGPDPPTGVELGSAILPNITCTGSSSVSFTRTLNQRFYVQLMTEEKNRDDFQLDGNDNGGGHDDFPDNLNWVQVPGTGDNGTEETWYTATVKLGDVGTGLSTGSPYTISNTEGIFHLSILDENDGSMSFGYFSDYTNLRIHEYELKCMGETLTLETNNTDGTYYWYYEDDMYNPITEDPTLSIEVSEPGKYWVEEDGGCYQTDTVDVEFSMPEFSLGNDTAVCPGESVTWEIEANNADDEFLWQPGNVTSNRFEITPDPDEEVEVSLTMTDDLGCSRTESVTVTGYSPPVIDWNISGEDICLGDTLKTETEMDGYQWTIDGNTDPADTLSYIVPDHSGEYELTVYTEENCSETQSIDLTVHDLPQPNLDDVSECPGEEATFNPGSFDTYLWHDDSENSSYTATSPEKVKVTVTDNNGCVASDSANFEWYNENVFTFGEDTSVCINDDILIAVDEIAAPGENYEWTFSEDGTGPEQILSTTTHELDITNASHSDEGSYTVATVDDNGCDVEDDFYLTVEDTPDLDLENGTDICRGDTIKITTQDHRFVEFEWRNTDDDLLSEENFVLVSEEDTYELTAWQANGCSQTATTEISVYDSPTFDLTDVTVCPNADTGIEMENWSSPQPTDDTREPRDFTWSTGNPRTEHATTEALENPEEGTYYLTVYDERCFHTDSVEVNHYDLPDIELEDDAFCENETFTLQIPSDLETEVNSYFWEQNNSSDTGPSDSDMEVSDEGDYTLHITDNHGCESSGTLTLSHLPVPEFNLGDDRDKCPGDTIMIETDPSFTRYEWNGDSSDDQAYHIEVSSSTTQSLQVWNEEGCTSEDEVSISLLPQPDVDLGGDREGCPGEKFELEVDDYDEIYWTNGDKDIRSITASKGRHGVLVVN